LQHLQRLQQTMQQQQIISQKKMKPATDGLLASSSSITSLPNSSIIGSGSSNSITTASSSSGSFPVEFAESCSHFVLFTQNLLIKVLRSDGFLYSLYVSLMAASSKICCMLAIAF